MKRLLSLLTAVLFVTALPLAAFAKEVTFTARDPFGRDVAKFETSAPLETIIGTTNVISGEVRVNLEDITNSRATFEVDVASFNSGNQKRDQDMREKFLHTDRYPKARLTLIKILSSSNGRRLIDGEPIEIKAEGILSLHGVERPVVADLTVTYLKESEATRSRLPGDLLRVSGTLPLKLSDFNIERPQLLILRLSDDVKVSVDLIASTKRPGKALNPCAVANPCAPVNPCSANQGKW
ncbi:MAG: YceI family protein [Candidatus Methylomirabilales bacterium]